MAKQKKTDEPQAAPLQADQPRHETYEQAQAAAGWLLLQIGAYQHTRIRLSPSEAKLVLAMRDQLKGEHLDDGTPITNNTHVFRYLLQQVATND